MQRKAQLLGHIIVFVIGLFIISAVLLFGYQVLDNLQEKRCDLTRVQFGTDLKTVFNGNKDFGVFDKAVLTNIPCETTMVCFVDRRISDEATGGEPPATINYVPEGEEPPIEARNTILNSFTNQIGTNIFTVQNNGFALPVEAFNTNPAPIQVTGYSGTPGGVCIAVEGGTLTLHLEGTGREAEVYIP